MLQLAQPAPHSHRTRSIHRVGFDTFARRRRFVDPAITARVVEAMHDARYDLRSRVLAWLLLPDGWLGVMECSRARDLRDDIDSLRQAMAKALPASDDADPVWAAGTDVRPIRDDAELADAVRTILVEPVHLGLAHQRGDYPWWGAIWHRPERASVAPAILVPAA